MNFRNVIINILIIINLFCLDIYSHETRLEDNNKKTILVGFYEYSPYYTIDEDGKYSGYYVELLDLLSAETNYKFKYINCNFSDGMKMLEEGNIDLMLGVNLTEERKDKFIFSNNSIAAEKFGIYTKFKSNYGDISKLNNKSLGVTEGGLNSRWILDFLESKYIDIESVWVKDVPKLYELIDEGKVDSIFVPIQSGIKYNLIYEYTSGPVYMAANKNNYNIIHEIDNAMGKYILKEDSRLKKLYNSYFMNMTIDKFKLYEIILIVLFSIALWSMFYYPRLKCNKIKSNIRSRMKNNEYLLYYQPIYNPKEESIIGFESLLRLKSEESGIISPYEFMPEIENNNMLKEVSLWILDKVVNDYKTIKKYNNMNGIDFYISLNLSLREIENEDFINKAIEILKKSEIEEYKICLEIVEKVKVEDVSKLKRYINILKNAGFIIAIDDFGIEYSNLDILEKVEFDIIKLDKFFADDIGKKTIKEEILKFISNISELTNKSVVVEGIETEIQNEFVKNMNNKFVYIQGYFYNKPMPIEDIKNI